MRQLLAAIALTAAATSALAAYEDSCKAKPCKPGDIVKVFSPKDDRAPVCATKALHSYVATVIGMMQVQARMGVKPAPEEEYKGETKAFVDRLRKEAGVSDFKQASQACSLGKHRDKVAVIEVDDASGQMRVAPVNGQPQFWIWDTSLER